MRSKRYYRRLAAYSSIVFILPTTIVGLFLVGRYLDRQIGSTPWLTIGGFFLGVIVAGYELYRILQSGESGEDDG